MPWATRRNKYSTNERFTILERQPNAIVAIEFSDHRGPQWDAGGRWEYTVSVSIRKGRDHDQIAGATCGPEAAEPELGRVPADQFVVLGIEPQHRHLDLWRHFGEHLGQLVLCARIAFARFG